MKKTNILDSRSDESNSYGGNSDSSLVSSSRSGSDDSRASRGRPFIPEMWSRVISFSNDNLNDVKAY